jgi:DNA polymerase III subunit epsilon
MRQVFLDTETTGLSAEAGHRIIEIGCIEMVDRRLTERNKHYYLNPERPNDPEAVKVHGLSDEFLADKPRFASIANELIDYLVGAEVIIHNAEFDVSFLNVEFQRVGREPVQTVVGGVVDTLAMARDLYPGKSNSLDALCKRLGVDNSVRTTHGALLDAGLLAQVYIGMTRGQESLVIDAHEAGTDHAMAIERIDLSALNLPTIEPSVEELRAHEAWLASLDRTSGGKSVWRPLVA